LAAAATAEAAKRNWVAFCISIVGLGANLVYFEMLDNYWFASVTISQHEARTPFYGSRCDGRLATLPSTIY
jgi:uncharacterized protein GlcG (DUF336 family)